MKWRDVARFWVPLAMTGTLMAVTPALINAGIAFANRLRADALAADAAMLAKLTAELAAFGVAFHLSRLLHSPHLYLTQVCLRYVDTHENQRHALRFVVQATLVVVAVKAVVAFSPVGLFLVERVTGLSPELAGEAIRFFQALVLLPAFMALRSFGQSLLMHHHVTMPVTIGTALRIAVLAAAFFVGAPLTGMSGPMLGVIGFQAGLLAEAAWVNGVAYRRGYVAPNLRVALRVKNEVPALARPHIARFGVPLMLAATVGAFDHSVAQAALARTSEPTVAIAAFSVAAGLMFLIVAPGAMLQHTAQAMVRDAQSHAVVARFSAVVAVVLTGLSALMLLPVSREVLVSGVNGLAGAAEVAAAFALAGFVTHAAVVCARCFWQGASLSRGDSGRVSRYTFVRIGLLSLGALVVAVVNPPQPGAFVALAWSMAMLVETVMLRWAARVTR